MSSCGENLIACFSSTVYDLEFMSCGCSSTMTTISEFEMGGRFLVHRTSLTHFNEITLQQERGFGVCASNILVL